MFAVVAFNLLYANESRELSVQSLQSVEFGIHRQTFSLLFVRNNFAQHINKIYINLSRKVCRDKVFVINEA